MWFRLFCIVLNILFILVYYFLKKGSLPKDACKPRYILMNIPGSGSVSTGSVGGCFSSSSFIIRSLREGLVFGIEDLIPCSNIISSWKCSNEGM